MIEKIQNKKTFLGLKIVLFFCLFCSLIVDGELSKFIHFVLYDKFINVAFALFVFIIFTSITLFIEFLFIKILKLVNITLDNYVTLMVDATILFALVKFWQYLFWLYDF